MIRILIADDHAIVRQGLERILHKEFPSAEIEEVSSGEEALKKVIKSDWTLIISDLSMPGRSGLEILLQIKEIKPHLPVLIISMHPEEQYALRVLKAGASGYLNKAIAPEELITAVHKVLAGKKYITPAIAERLAENFDQYNNKLPHEHLSDREFEVMKLLSAGNSITDIASRLSISSSTVSTYRSRILEKMNLKTNADLTTYGINNQLL